MASLPQGVSNWSSSGDRVSISVLGISDPPLWQPRTRTREALFRGKFSSQSLLTKGTSYSPWKGFRSKISKKVVFTSPRCSSSPESGGSQNDSSGKGKVAFGNTRKDVLLIGAGITVFGIGLKTGLEFIGVDPLQAGSVVQLVLVLGLTVGWISTYFFRVSNKEMTYAKQLRDYEYKVMQKRLEGLTEAELEALLEQVEEDKRRIASRKRVNRSA